MNVGSPGCPRLTEGIAGVPIEAGYVFEGGPRTEVFTGTAAQQLLPRLLPLLDGSRQLSEIAAVLQLPLTAVRQAIDVLWQRKLLDSVAASPAGPGPGSTPMRTFLLRSVPGGRGEAIDRRLRAATVMVVTTGPAGAQSSATAGRLADLIAGLLRRSGVCKTERCEGWPPGQIEHPAGLVLLVTEAGGSPVPAPGASARFGTCPVLRVCLESQRALVGPLVNVPGYCCPGCAEAALDGVPAEPGANRTRPAGLDNAALTAACAGLAVGAALRYIADHDRCWALCAVREIRLVGAPRDHQAVPQPGCPACGHPGLVLRETELAEYNSEHAVPLAPAGWDLDPLSHADGRWQGAPMHYLTEPRLRARLARGAAAVDLGLPGRQHAPVLSWMLARSVGPMRRDRSAPGVRGWSGRGLCPPYAPSAGCQGNIRAYLLGDITGEGSAVYYYDALSREFVALPGRPSKPAGKAREVTVILTSELAALAPVFGPATRRIIYQDAGLVLAHLHACAQAVGWRLATHQYDPHTLYPLLDLDPEREAIAAVACLDSPDLTRPPSPAVARQRLSATLCRLPVTYQFDDQPVTGGIVTRLADDGISGARGIARLPAGLLPGLNGILYARHVKGLTFGLHRLDAGQEPAPLSDTRTDPIEDYLRDRCLDPPAMLLLTADLAAILAAHGSRGYPALLTQAAAAAGLVHLAAGRAGLAAGLLARVPAAMMAACLPGPVERHRVLYGCVVGHPRIAPDIHEPKAVAW